MICRHWLVNARFMTYREACAALELHPAAFVQWRNRGYIPLPQLIKLQSYGEFPFDRYFDLQARIIRSNANDK